MVRHMPTSELLTPDDDDPLRGYPKGKCSEKRVVMEHFTKVFKENAFVIFHCSFLFLLMSEKGLGCVW